jgi:outer membrane protein OmpA-like peptidoglycan-associated protein
MSPTYLKSFFTCFVLLLLSGCAQKTTVVLLADPNGQVGNLSVANSGGEVEMNRAAEATTVTNREARPGKPEILSEQQIASQFSVVLTVLPLPPEHFLLYFQTKSTQLTVESEAILPQIIQSIKNRNSEDITVVGHSDTAGDRSYNLHLSKERALAVSQILIRNGVKAEQITSTSHGEENPLIKTADNVQEAKNRRVEVVVK